MPQRYEPTPIDERVFFVLMNGAQLARRLDPSIAATVAQLEPGESVIAEHAGERFAIVRQR